MRLMIQAVLVCSFLVISISASADIMFPANQFGDLNLRPKQSLGGNSDFIRSQENAVFEPISEFNEGDVYRDHSRPVGRLSILTQLQDGTQGVGTCTATLVARDLVLTNYHCIPGLSGIVLDSEIHFGYLRQDQELDSVGAYKVDINPVASDENLDFALLRVKGFPGDTYGVVKLDVIEVKPNASLLIYHHPAGLPLRLTRFRCKAYSGRAYSDGSFRHRCDTLGGSSGSLIYDNNHRVVALHHSGGLNGASSTSFNTGTDIRLVLRYISDKINGGLPIKPKAVVPSSTPSTPKFVIASIPSNVSDNKMNVRSGPGLGHALVGSIPGGVSDVTVYIDSCRKSDDNRTKKPWCRISWQGVDGWTSSGGLRW
ncbi:trypsin-like peptidase domain-containing protein [Vibrio breoganii]|uniref:trypsin-like peptidase domain-containing protein n=1 Tax=Vibrio breoganii TaxID=553239 RepID=UPI000C85027C|nr:trypsin-like peptidase domain-containing protein [Vibrio breoganii]PMG93902.1 hypothetical protein BCU80_07745 [Vibrio breoganii]